MLTKEEILEEIRRLAIDGVSVGEQVFRKQTGLPSSYWKGTYWIRFVDAVKEAGLTPSAQVVAIGKEVLLEQLARMALHYGHIPTQAETVFFKKNVDSSVANRGTFRMNLGLAEGWSKLLHSWAVKNGRDDLLVILHGTVERRKITEKLPALQTEFVYLVKMGNLYKIGKANDPKQRINSINWPEKEETIHVIESEDGLALESALKLRFKKLRAREDRKTEWFRLSKKDVQNLMKIKRL